MGRFELNSDLPSSDQTQVRSHTEYNDRPPPPPPHAGYAAHNNQHMHQPPPPSPPPPTASYPPQPAQPPPPETYPPQKPTVYPPQQSQQPPAAAAAYPPQPQPVSFPPPSPQMGRYPPQQGGAPPPYPAQNYGYAQQNNGPQQVYHQQQQQQQPAANYQTAVKMGPQEGIPVGSQFLAPTQGWSSDLFACMDDPENAIITACFPCVTYEQIAEIVDNGQTSCMTSGIIYGVIAAFIGIPCIISCTYRTKMRSRYGLIETPAPDWATHLFCEWCALCQEYRELKAHGVDPAIGWQANLEKNQQMQYNPAAAMAPPQNQTMMG